MNKLFPKIIFIFSFFGLVLNSCSIEADYYKEMLSIFEKDKMTFVDKLNKNDLEISLLKKENENLKTQINNLKASSANTSNLESLINDLNFLKTEITTLKADLNKLQPNNTNNNLNTNDVSSLKSVITNLQSSNIELNNFIKKQFNLIYFDDFETSKSLEGWSDNRTMQCEPFGNKMLGGHCNFSTNEVSKTYNNLPSHTSLRVQASYSMLRTWDGETGYMKIDGRKVWIQKGAYFEPSYNYPLCNGISILYLNIPIDMSIAHSDYSVKITFGSSLDQDPCDESYGFDNVIISVK